jgi:hypothetical protein
MFHIAIADCSQTNESFRFYAGRMVLGKEIEFLRCAAGRWAPYQYLRQWRAAASQLASHPMATSAFVTSVARGSGNIEWWLARRRGDSVVFTNQLLFLRKPRPRVVPEQAHEYRHPPTYRTASDRKRVSEWRLPYSAIRRYIRHASFAPNPSMERTVSSGLRPLPTAAHVKR